MNVNVNELIVAMLRQAILETRDRHLRLMHQYDGPSTHKYERIYYRACNALRRS